MPIDGVWAGILAAAMFVVSPAAGTAVAGTDTPPGTELSLSPIDQSGSYFSVAQSPGSTRTYTVGLVNSGSSDAAYSTYASDVYTLSGGGLGSQSAERERTGTTKWLEYPTQSGSLSAEHTQNRTFTISVPEHTSAGQYVTSLAIENAHPVAVGTTSGVTQILRNVIAVSIRVPGKLVPAFSTGQATATEGAGQWQVHIPLRNSGNVVVKPAGTLRIVDANGVTVYSEKLAMGSVYPRTSTTIDFPLDHRVPHGYYTIVFDLSDADSGVVLSKNVPSLVVGSPPPEIPARDTRLNIGLSLLGGIPLGAGIVALFLTRRRSSAKMLRARDGQSSTQ